MFYASNQIDIDWSQLEIRLKEGQIQWGSNSMRRQWHKKQTCYLLLYSQVNHAIHWLIDKLVGGNRGRRFVLRQSFKIWKSCLEKWVFEMLTFWASISNYLSNEACFWLVFFFLLYIMSLLLDNRFVSDSKPASLSFWWISVGHYHHWV